MGECTKLGLEVHFLGERLDFESDLKRNEK